MQYVFYRLSGLGRGVKRADIAWRGIVKYLDTLRGSAQLIVYGGADEEEICCRSGAVACRGKWNCPPCCAEADTLGLLLASALTQNAAHPSARNAEKVVFLQNEAWRPQGWLTQAMLGRADRFLANSHHTWHRFLDFQPQFRHKPHQIVPLGIGSEYQGATPPTDQIPTALMLGRLLRSEDYKGHRQIIAAWSGVLKRIPDAQLWIAGDGELRPDLEALSCQCGYSRTEHFLGLDCKEKKQ